MADYDVTLRTGLDTKDVEAQASKLRSRIEQIFKQTDGKAMSASFVRLKQNLRELYNQSAETTKKIEALNAQGTKDVPTEAYAHWEKELEKVDAKLRKLQEDRQILMQTPGVSPNELGKNQTQISRAQAREAYIKQEMDALRNAGAAFNQVLVKDTKEYQDLIAKQEKLNDRIQIGVLRANEMRNTTRQTIHPFQEMHSAVTKVAHTIGKVVSGIKSLVNRLRGVNTGLEDTQKSMRKLLKFALKYFLGLRSIFILYKRIRSAGVEAYKGLAKQFPELNAELNELRNSFFQLKNSIATMAQPILSYLVPAIQTLMSWLTAAMNALANFFAIFTGAKYIYKATKQNKDWSKSASGAGKAAKEASEDIAEYDNLILIQQDKNNSGGGGGGAADEYAGAWEKVEAESDFAQKLKDAINQGNWEEVGNLFAEKLNGVVDTFDNWLNNTFRPKGKLWADRIGRILNGLTDGFNAKKLGTTLADGVNAIFDIFNTFLKRYNFKKLGTRVGEAITGFFTRLDPKLIGNTLANKFNAAINFWGGLIKSTDFKVIGSRIGVALKTLIEDIQWAELGANLSNLAAGILEGLSQFIIDSDLGVTVGNAINEFLSKIDFGRLMRDLSDLAINILNALADAIETVDWEMVGQAIADMLKNIDWGKFLTALMRVALGLIKGLGTALLQIATDPEALGSLATGLLAIFGAKWLWSKITGLFTSGLTSAIGTAAGSVGAGSVGALGAAIAGVATFKGVGSLAGAMNSYIAYDLFGDDVMSEYYEEFSKAPIQYTVQAFSEAVSAAQEYSETTGKKTLANAWSMMWGGDDVMEIAKENAEKSVQAAEDVFKRAQLSWSTDKGGLGLGREVTDTEWFAYRYGEAVEQIKEASGTLASSTESAFSGVGKAINNMATEMEGAVTAGRKSLGLYQTDSSHYVDVAKSNAEAVRNTVKIAEQTSNHYVEIAKQNSGYYDKIKAETEATSNHYVQIAQANAQAVTNTAKEAEASSNHYVEIAKANAQAVQASHKEMEDASTHYVGVAKQNVDAAIENANRMATEIENSVSGIPDSYDKTFSSAYEKVTGAFDGTKSYFQQVAEGVKAPFGTMGEYFDDTFTDAWGNVVDVFQTDTPHFQSIQDNISGSFKTMINGMITGVNNSITSPFQTLSSLISRMKGMDVGGNKIFSGLPNINVPKIPRLAQGAVLPPNSPFLAMVGDQKSGTNIETPLATMVEAFKQAMRESGGESREPIILTLNGKQIAQVVWDEENKRYKQTGMRYKYS